MGVNSNVEFTSQYPLIVIVGRIGGQWDIQVSDKVTFPGDNKLHSVKMFERIKNEVPGGKDGLEEEWKSRLVQNGPAQPHFIANWGHHNPIVTRAGETVQFQCDYPFRVWAHRELNLVPVLASPDNPYGWNQPQESTLRAPYTVTATAVGNLTAQRFYKCVAWITVSDTQTVLVDPDDIGI
jgi:hypothetical protein